MSSYDKIMSFSRGVSKTEMEDILGFPGDASAAFTRVV